MDQIVSDSAGKKLTWSISRTSGERRSAAIEIRKRNTIASSDGLAWTAISGCAGTAEIRRHDTDIAH
jgi:hypothetical protein